MVEKLPSRNPSNEEIVDLDVGDEVTAIWATEKFAPVQYQSFDVGPFIVRTKVREGETGIEAFKRAYAACRAAARSTYPEKRDEFIANVHDAVEKTRDSSSKRR